MGQDVGLSAVSVDCLHEEDEVHFGEDLFGRVDASAPRVLGPHCDDGTRQVIAALSASNKHRKHSEPFRQT